VNSIVQVAALIVVKIIGKIYFRRGGARYVVEARVVCFSQAEETFDL
jgi:hypothetical protein